MLIIRPVRSSDLNGIERCALTAGAGMTHLPRHHEALEKQIDVSVNSFAKQVVKPVDEQYLFVLADSETGVVGGTCGIYSNTGVSSPFYVYNIDTIKPANNRLPPPREPRLLTLYPYVNGPSEICALYLLPEYRHSGLGKLVSLSRFLFIAANMQRFTPTLIANMRGIIENNVSPFWNSIGRHFLDVELQEVMNMRMNNEHLISDIFPPNPIYVTLLPRHVQDIIGQVHIHTKPALGMLQAQGFNFANQIDPVDGGPIIRVDTKKVTTIKESKLTTVTELVTHKIVSDRFLISNNKLDYRACLGEILIKSPQDIVLTEEVAKALEVKRGDTIRYIPCTTQKKA